MQKYTRPGMNVDFYPALYSAEDSKYIYDTLEQEIKWLKPMRDTQRNNQIYGDDGLVYEVKFSNYNGKPEKVTRRKAVSWTECPLLIQIRDGISSITHEKYNICVVQRYPNGNVGISPHKDKEMVPGTTICGLSFGSTRTLSLGRYNDTVKIDLTPGSMYVLNPPTNDYWTHAIEKCTEPNARISLTFRNYPI